MTSPASDKPNLQDNGQVKETGAAPAQAAPGPVSADDLFLRYHSAKERPEDDPERKQLRDQLVMMHVNLVRYLANKFANRGEPLEDLVQVGTIGLINAVNRFDPSMGNKFSTYAAPTIVGEIKRHFRDKAWNLKVPRRLQELNLAVGKAVEALTQTLGRSPTVPEIAKHINATDEETLEAIELGNAYETVSLDSRMDFQGDSGPMTLAEFIGDEDAQLRHIQSFADLEKAIQSLDPRERAIIQLRFYHDLSQSEVAQRLNISQMHVSRLQQKSLKKLRAILLENV